jgi:hypothetical protein
MHYHAPRHPDVVATKLIAIGNPIVIQAAVRSPTDAIMSGDVHVSHAIVGAVPLVELDGVVVHAHARHAAMPAILLRQIVDVRVLIVTRVRAAMEVDEHYAIKNGTVFSLFICLIDFMSVE